MAWYTDEEPPEHLAWVLDAWNKHIERIADLELQVWQQRKILDRYRSVCPENLVAWVENACFAEEE
jgi:hypothetical protein